MPLDTFSDQLDELVELLEENNQKLARKHAKQVIKDGEAELDEVALALLLHYIGSAFCQHRDFKTGISLLEHALELKRTSDAPARSLAPTLNNLGAAHHELGNLDKAEAFYGAQLGLGREALSFEDRIGVVRALGSVLKEANKTRDLAEFLEGEAQVLQRLAMTIAPQDRDAAGFLAGEAASLLEMIRPDHPLLPGPMCLMGRLLRESGNLDAAERAYRNAEALCGKKDRQGRSAAVNGLAMIALARGDKARGVALLEEAIDLAGDSFPEQSLNALANLGQIHPDAGRREKALIRVLALADRANELYAHVCQNALEGLVKLYVEQLRITEAVAFADRLADATNTPTTSPPHRVAALRLRGVAYRLLRRLPEAIESLEAAARLSATLPDPELHISTLCDLALAYVRRGDLARAKATMSGVFDAIEQHEIDGATLALALNQLATLHEEMQDLDKAEQLYDKALAALGDDPEHGSLRSPLLNNRALLWRKRGKWEAAAKGFEEVLALRRQHGYARNVGFAEVLRNLASLFEEIATRMTSTELAGEPLYLRSIELLNEAKDLLDELGETKTSHYCRVIFGLAWIAACRGRFKEAEKHYDRAESLATKLGITTLPFEARSFQDRANLFAATGRYQQAMQRIADGMRNAGLSYESVFAAGDDATRLAYAERWAGDLHVLVSLAASHLKTPEARRLALEMVLTRKGVVTDAAVSQRIIRDISEGAHAELAERLRTVEARIERAVVETPADVASLRAQRDTLRRELSRAVSLPLDVTAIQLEQVATALPAGSALVEIMWCATFDPDAIPARGQSRWSAPHYFAFVLRAGESTPDLLDLGPALKIDELVTQWRTHVETRLKGRNLPRPKVKAAPDDQALKATAASLRAAVFDPVRERLGDRNRLFVATDGQLALVPFEALHDGGSSYLLDAFEISYVWSGRDLLRHGRASHGAAGPPCVAANPEYGHPKLGSHVFEALPGTKLEGEAIAAQLGIEMLGGKRLTKQALRGLRSPLVLHLATHGFFLDSNTQAIDPLHRAGLALAGANEHGVSPTSDGILWAADAHELTLANTELVVLSACSTGVGSVRVGEGVFGFRRAFAIAGAPSLVMTLWRIPDEHTQIMMSTFYRELRGGRGPAAALRAAQQELRKNWDHPAFWGAFMCQGDPTPIWALTSS